MIDFTSLARRDNKAKKANKNVFLRLSIANKITRLGMNEEKSLRLILYFYIFKSQNIAVKAEGNNLNCVSYNMNSLYYHLGLNGGDQLRFSFKKTKKSF